MQQVMSTPFYGTGKNVPPRRACRQAPQNSFAWKSATDNEKGRRPPGGTSESAALFPTNRIGAEYCAAGEAGELSVVTGGSREAALFPL